MKFSRDVLPRIRSEDASEPFALLSNDNCLVLAAQVRGEVSLLTGCVRNAKDVTDDNFHVDVIDWKKIGSMRLELKNDFFAIKTGPARMVVIDRQNRAMEEIDFEKQTRQALPAPPVLALIRDVESGDAYLFGAQSFWKVGAKERAPFAFPLDLERTHTSEEIVAALVKCCSVFRKTR